MRPVETSPENGGFALTSWLRHGLAGRYDAVLQEPVPPEFMRILDTDRAQRGP